jgi:3-oxoacyl-[acyl-carrier-protein] synthase II
VDLSGGRTVTVTGMGLVSPLGCDLVSVWGRTMRGESGAVLMPRRKSGGTGVPYYCPVTEERPAADCGRHLRFALTAAEAAVEDAGLDLGVTGLRVGVCIGTSKGELSCLEKACALLRQGKVNEIDRELLGSIAGASAASAVSARWKLKCPVGVPVAACATGAHAIFLGERMIRRGEADVVVAGASDSCLSPLLLAGYLRMGVLAVHGNSPAEACRPYDADRSGFVIGEGCGIVILEEEGHAARRGARVLAKLKGSAIGEDIHHATAPDPSGRALAGVITAALRSAGLTGEEIDYVNTHGTGTRLNDPAETRAVKRAFGAHASELSLSSTKPLTGHLLGAAGSVEFIISVMALGRGVIPPTINLRRSEPECDLDYTPLIAKKRDIRNFVSISSGFGGHIAALVAGKPDSFRDRIDPAMD